MQNAGAPQTPDPKPAVRANVGYSISIVAGGLGVTS